MENENKALNDEELDAVTGGVYGRDNSGLWRYVMESVYNLQLEQLMRSATHSEDRAIIRRYFSAIMSTYGGYQGDKVALINELYEDSQTAVFIDQQLKEKVVSIMGAASGFASRY